MLERKHRDVVLQCRAGSWVHPPSTSVILFKFHQKKLATCESLLYVLHDVTSLQWGCYPARCKTSSTSMLFAFVIVKFGHCDFIYFPIRANINIFISYLWSILLKCHRLCSSHRRKYFCLFWFYDFSYVKMPDVKWGLVKYLLEKTE